MVNSIILMKFYSMNNVHWRLLKPHDFMVYFELIQIGWARINLIK